MHIPNFLLAGVFLAPTWAGAESSADFGQDLMLTVLARKALLDDRELAPLNLGVRVHNRVASLWGPVPSPLLADRAIRMLSSLPELVQVRNDMHIAVEEEVFPVPRTVPQLPWAPGGSPATLTIHEKASGGVGRPAPSASGVGRTAPSVGTTPKVGDAPNGALSESAWQTVRPGQDPRMPDHREFEVVLPSLRLPTPPLSNPAAAALDRTIGKSLNDLRRDPRFRSIDVKVKDSLVTLTGDPAASLYDFAHAVSHLPGVARVIVKERP